MKPNFKYGAHQFLWIENWTDKSLPLLEEVRLLGLDCFEISLGDDVFFDPEPVKRIAGDLNLELTVGPGNLWPMDCDISLKEKKYQQKGIEWHRKMVEQACEIGAVAYCGATYGHPGHILREPKSFSELEQIAEHLHYLADYAVRLNVKLVIEPMSRFRTHILHTAQDAMNLLNMVQHKNLFINLDTFHMITEERDYSKAIKTCSIALWGIHACENDRGVPGGGLVPWADVFRALSETNPYSRILMETYRTGFDGFGYKRGVFQDLCPHPADFVKVGLDFLKQQVNML